MQGIKGEKMSKTDVTSWRCDKVNANVTITKESWTHQSSRMGVKNIDLMIGCVTDCSHSRKCGVVQRSGEIDWKQCIHPKRPE
jgi:hypothetical protein